ncbi:Hypothetical predicted protein [Marmota monax]|uniref:Uncharacterized protein n=1 Tax=Marmota monax TaxID=9995 RepID=A0A5E4B9P6_MARMO|nr:hypothetical protein GHT09_006209 [Marmota monax]VTJ65559.1 Hypothetical predicted protein [Marmota monax]
MAMRAPSQLLGLLLLCLPGHDKNPPGSRSVKLGCPSCSSCCLHLLRALLRGSQALRSLGGFVEGSRELLCTLTLSFSFVHSVELDKWTVTSVQHCGLAQCRSCLPLSDLQLLLTPPLLQTFMILHPVVSPGLSDTGLALTA